MNNIEMLDCISLNEDDDCEVYFKASREHDSDAMCNYWYIELVKLKTSDGTTYEESDLTYDEWDIVLRQIVEKLDAEYDYD